MENLKGKVKDILTTVVRELTGLEKTKWATVNEGTWYPKAISYNPNSGVLEIDSLHLKLLCGEMNNGAYASVRDIHVAVREIMGSDFNKNNWIYTSVQVVNENLQELLNGQTTAKVYRYSFGIQDFLPQEDFVTIGQ